MALRCTLTILLGNIYIAENYEVLTTLFLSLDGKHVLIDFV